MPVSSSGSPSSSSAPSARPIAPKSVEPVAPYSSASPYSSVAEPSYPTTRYFSPDSSDDARRSSVAQST